MICFSGSGYIFGREGERGYSNILRENTERLKGSSMPRIFSLPFPFIVLVFHY